MLNKHGHDFPERREERAQYLVARFQRELGHDCILSALATCRAHTIDGNVPAVVLAPTSPEAVAAALEIAAEMQVPLAPWGGGTQMALGYPVEHLDAVISTVRLHAVTAHEAGDGIIAVQSGCTVAALNQTLARSQQFVALDGALASRATVGGRLATGSNGLRRTHYGGLRDLVLDLRVAHSDGTLTHTTGEVLQEAAGYDLNKLFIGSLGTLGIIVEATLRVAHLPAGEATVVAAFDDATAIWELLNDLNAALMQPAAVVVCGPGSLGAKRGLTDGHADILQPAAHPLLLVRLAGSSLIVRKHALVVRALALKYGAQDPLLLHDAAMQDLWTNLEDLAATADLLPTEAVLKVAALPSEIGTVIDVARDTCMEHELRLCWSADAAAGVGWLRVVRDDGDEEHFSAGLRALQVMLARRWRNAIVVGCSAALRRHLPLWGADPQGLELMRAIKSQFDPAGILNPGRFG